MEIKVLILTPLPLEYDAVVRHLSGDRNSFVHDAAAYEQGTFEGKYHKYKVIVREPGMRNVDMALATERAIQHVQPHIVLLIGIAGGVKDVRIGDVLVAKKVYGYESGKEDSDGFKARPAVESFSGTLLAWAQTLSRNTHWRSRTHDNAPEAKVFIGPIAAGDKVVAASNNDTFQRIKTHYNDTLGLEMEAIGFGTALQGHRQIHGLVIRGISDLCEGKAETDKQNWQPIAAERAAAFGFELLYEMNGASMGFETAALSKETTSVESRNVLKSDDAIAGVDQSFKKDPNRPMPLPLRVFISYSHNKNDRPLLDQLLKQAAPLVQAGKITIWEDAQISPGAVWDDAIKENLGRADIVVLLVSSDYAASDYINQVEVPIAMQRQAAGLCQVIPVLLRSCLFDLMPYSIYEFLPKTIDNQRLVPVDKWDNTDEAFAVVVKRLHKLTKQIADDTAAPPSPTAQPSIKQTPASEFERKGNEQLLNLATQKLQRLQSAHLLETGASQQFAYEQEIQKLEALIQNLKSQV